MFTRQIVTMRKLLQLFFFHLSATVTLLLEKNLKDRKYH
jgi:hypothetical protein